MSEYLIQDSTLTNIANPLRTLGETTGGKTPAQMASIVTGANTTIETQSGLLDDVQTALAGKTGAAQTKTLTLGAETPQTVTPSTGYMLSSVPVELDSTIIKAENIAKDVTVLGITGTHQGGIIPTGNIELQQQTGTDVTNYATASVKSGSVTVETPTIDTSTGVVTGIASVSDGYVSGTPASKMLSLSTQAAKTVTPSTSSQTAVAAGKYTTGAVTVAGDANLVAGNIKKDISIFGITGTLDPAVGGDTVANIAVTYPSGSICTATLGSTILTAPDTSGSYTFPIRQVGTWTIACTDGSQSASSPQSIVVPTYGINLSYVHVPTKGQIITMTLGNSTPAVGINNTYRVLDIVDTTAFVVAMFDQTTSTSFNSYALNVYNGSSLDTYLNTTWYNSLNTTAKSAIQSTNITQYQYNFATSVYDANNHASCANYSTKAVKEVIGNRYIYALDVEDIETYFNGTFSTSDIWTLFWNTSSAPSTITYPWLRSADAVWSGGAWAIFGNNGGMDDTRGVTDAGAAHPAFKIDLSKISWS